MTTYAVSVNVNGQITTINVFADTTVEAINNAKNIAMGKFGNNPRIQIISATPFNSCAPVTVVNANTRSQSVSNFVASSGKSM